MAAAKEMADDKQCAVEEKADIEEKLQRVADFEAIQAENARLQAEKAQFQR